MFVHSTSCIQEVGIIQILYVRGILVAERKLAALRAEAFSANRGNKDGVRKLTSKIGFGFFYMVFST